MAVGGAYVSIGARFAVDVVSSLWQTPRQTSVVDVSPASNLHGRRLRSSSDPLPCKARYSSQDIQSHDAWPEFDLTYIIDRYGVTDVTRDAVEPDPIRIRHATKPIRTCAVHASTTPTLAIAVDTYSLSSSSLDGIQIVLFCYDTRLHLLLREISSTRRDSKIARSTHEI